MGVVVGEGVTLGICAVKVGSWVGKVCIGVVALAQPANHELIHNKLNADRNILFITITCKDICSSPLDDLTLTYAECWQVLSKRH
jgi:hypothetical protein